MDLDFARGGGGWTPDTGAMTTSKFSKLKCLPMRGRLLMTRSCICSSDVAHTRLQRSKFRIKIMRF